METSSKTRQSARLKLKQSSISTDNNQVVHNSERRAEKRIKQEVENELIPSLSSSVGAQNATIENLPNEMLLKILKHVPTQTVLSCRKMNRRWCQIATIIFRDRPDTLVSFNYICLESRYKTDNGKTLEDLNKVLETSKNFPYTHFSFNRLSSLLRGQGLAFFKAWGENIKCLEFEFNGSKQEARSLCELLFKLASNIQHFKLRDSHDSKLFESSLFSTNKKDSSLPPSSFVLPKLKILDLSEEYRNYPRIVLDIINAAPNLEKVTGPWENSYMIACLTEHDIKFFYDCKKLHLLRNVEIQPEPEFMTFWETFPVKGGKDLLKLEKISLLVDQQLGKVPEQCVRAGSFINDIVQSSKSTLRELSMDAIGFLPGIDWSIFDNLEKLSLRKPARSCAARQPFFPRNLSSMNILPNLQEIHFKDLSLSHDCLPEINKLPSIPSVRVITISRFMEEPEMIKKVGVMCPNVSTVVIGPHGLFNFPAIGSVIWENMKKLKILHLGIKLSRDGDCRNNVFPFLDSVFTGFSSKTVKALMKQYKQTGTVSLDKKVRTSPSILDLKELEKLKIVFFDYNFYSIVNTSRTPVEEKMAAGRKSAMDALTIVSQVGAFELIPNLQVETFIEFHHHHGDKAPREELVLFKN